MTSRTMFTPTDFSPYPWMEFAIRELGTARTPGPSSNPRIQEYLGAAGLTGASEDIAWCSAFVNWVLAQVNIRGTHRANARSWLNWDGLCLGKPCYGAITVLSRAPNPAHGHVGFYVGEEAGQLVLLGGNQAGESSVCLNTYRPNRLLGYRWPPGIAVPR
jgi:uncharacterized protein (TIGR02594 family)